MHNILIHEANIIDTFVIPISQLSEEAQEARNKKLKRGRENNTKKSSPIRMHEDLWNFFLCSADLHLGSLRNVFPQIERPLLLETEELRFNTT